MQIEIYIRILHRRRWHGYFECHKLKYVSKMILIRMYVVLGSFYQKTLEKNKLLRLGGFFSREARRDFWGGANYDLVKGEILS